MQAPETPFQLWDKASHSLAFFTLLLLLDHAYPDRHALIHPLKIIGLFFYGLWIESMQSLLPYRDASFFDLIANITGLLCYLGVKSITHARHRADSPQHIWKTLQQQAAIWQQHSPVLNLFFNTLFTQPKDLAESLGSLLADKLYSASLERSTLHTLFTAQFRQQPRLIQSIGRDLYAFQERDSACHNICHTYCFYKGFHALCTYRVMHSLWQQGRQVLALQLQQRCAAVFDVDIHPAAILGSGIMLDHATGIVIGETAVIGDNVSIMQGVTLGGTGKAGGDRHPKLASDVLISVGATVLGNIHIGEGAQVAAGSVVLKPVAPHTCVAGVPAQSSGKTLAHHPAREMNHRIQ